MSSRPTLTRLCVEAEEVTHQDGPTIALDVGIPGIRIDSLLNPGDLILDHAPSTEHDPDPGIAGRDIPRSDADIAAGTTMTTMTDAGPEVRILQM